MTGKLKEKINSIIKKAGKRLGLDLPYFFKNGFWVFLKYALVSLAGLGITLLFARLGSKDDFGRYQLVVALLSLFSIFSLPGMNFLAYREIANGKPRVIIEAIKISFLASFIAIPFIILLGIYYIHSKDYMTGVALISASFLFPFFYGPNNWFSYYEANLNFKISSLRIIFSNVVVFLVMAILFIFKAKVLWLILAYFFLNAVFNNFFYWEICKKLEFEKREKIDYEYGLRCTWQKFSVVLYENIQAPIIFFIFGLDVLAVYQLGYFFVNSFAGLIGSLTFLYIPLLFKYKKINHKNTVIQNLIIGLVTSVLCLAVVKLFFVAIYGQNYKEGFYLAIWLSFSLILTPLRIYFLNFLASIEKNFQIVISNTLAVSFAFLIIFFLREKSHIFVLIFYYYTLMVVNTSLLAIFYAKSLKT